MWGRIIDWYGGIPYQPPKPKKRRKKKGSMSFMISRNKKVESEKLMNNFHFRPCVFTKYFINELPLHKLPLPLP